MSKFIVKYKGQEFPVADKAAVTDAVAHIKVACPKATVALQQEGAVAVVSAVGSKAQEQLQAALNALFPIVQTQSQQARPYSVPAAPAPAPAPAPEEPSPAPMVAAPAPAVAPAPAKAPGSAFGRFLAKAPVEDIADTWCDEVGPEPVIAPVEPLPAPVPVRQEPSPAPVVVAAPAPVLQQLPSPPPAPVPAPTETPIVKPPSPPKAPSESKAKVVAQTSTKAEAPVAKALKEAARAIEASPVTGIDHPQSGKLLRERIKCEVSGSVEFDSSMTVKDIAEVAIDGTKFFDFATKESLLRTIEDQAANPDTARFVALANIVHKDSKKPSKGKKSDGNEANKAEEAIVGVHFHYPSATNVGSKEEGNPELSEVQEWVIGGFGRLTESKYGTKEAAILIAFDQLFDRWNEMVKFSADNSSGLPSRLIVGTNFARAAAILTGRKLLKMEESRELYWYANHIFDKFKAINVEVSVVYTADDSKGDCEENLYGEVLAAHGAKHFPGRVEKHNFKGNDPLFLVELLSWHGANFARCLGKHLKDLLAGTKAQTFVIRP